jgi:hypothetical protein
VESLIYTSLPEIHDELVSTDIAKGDVTRDLRAGVTGEHCQKTIFDCGGGEESRRFFKSSPARNDMKNDDFYRADFFPFRYEVDRIVFVPP